jgi:hypothetical protein
LALDSKNYFGASARKTTGNFPSTPRTRNLRASSGPCVALQDKAKHWGTVSMEHRAEQNGARSSETFRCGKSIARETTQFGNRRQLNKTSYGAAFS